MSPMLGFLALSIVAIRRLLVPRYETLCLPPSAPSQLFIPLIIINSLQNFASSTTDNPLLTIRLWTPPPFVPVPFLPLPSLQPPCVHFHFLPSWLKIFALFNLN